MKKGFLFTLDAALALILVIILSAALVAQQNALPEKGGVSSSLRQQAEDRVITEFYLGDNDSEPIGGTDFGECAIVYIIDPDKGAGWSAPETKQVCEGV